MLAIKCILTVRKLPQTALFQTFRGYNNRNVYNNRNASNI